MAIVTLYTRRGCHLCDDAKAVLDAVRAEQAFDLSIVDIDSDPAIVARFTNDVPVIAVDGRVAFKHRLTADALLGRLRRPEPQDP